MSKKKSGCPHGHYCKICGEYKANEKFSGKGHAAHICKACSRLSAAEKAETQTITRLMNFPMGRLSANDKTWLENRLHDHRPEVAELAREVYNIHFPYAERNARKNSLSSTHWPLKSIPKSLTSMAMNYRSTDVLLQTASAASSP